MRSLNHFLPKRTSVNASAEHRTAKQEGHIQVDVTTTRFGAYDEGLFHCREAINCHDHVVSSGRVPAFNLLALLHIAHGHLSEVSLAVEQGLENFNLQRMAFPW